MTTPDERADSSARNAAIKIADEALKSGRIVQADHDMRVAQLKGAQTLQDIELAIRDLRTPPPMAPPTIAPVPPTPTWQQPPSVVQDTTGQPWPLVNYGPGAGGAGTTGLSAGTSSGKGGKAIVGIIAVIIVASVIVPIAGAVIAFFAARNSFPDFGTVGPSDDTTYLPGQTPGEDGVNNFTPEGFQALVDAVKSEKGDDFVFDASIFPRYASLELPTGTNNRYQSFYWDGEKLQLQDIKGTTDDGQVDLSLVDPQMAIDCVTKVHDRIDNANNWYVIIDDSFGSGAQMACYASNDFNESTYIVQGLDGTVLYDSEATAEPVAP